MPGPIKGLRVAGNINLYDRPHVWNPDNTVSTVRSTSFGTDKGETLVPTAATGHIMSEPEAMQQYNQTGQHLGIFDNPDDATAYAQQLHDAYAQHKFDVPLATSRKSVDPNSLGHVLKGLMQYGPYQIPD